MKKILLIITGIVFTCLSYSQDSEALDNDKLIKKHFNKKDIENLKKIMNFFDREVMQICDTNTSINICYEIYFEQLKSQAESDRLDLGFSYKKEVKMLTDLDKRSFNKIWYYTETYRLDKGIKVYYFPRTIELSYKSPFMNLCRDIASDNTDLQFYYENYQTAGTMNSVLIDGVLTRYDKFNFFEVRERLLIAVHYLTVNSRNYK